MKKGYGRRFILLLFLFLLVPISYAINECKGTTNTDDIPCNLFLPSNSCDPIQIDFYSNGSTFKYNQNMSQYDPFTCNATFNISQEGTYTFNYSTGDSGSIIVTEGFNMYLALGTVLAILVVLLVMSLVKEDQNVAQLSAVGFMVTGVWILINGISSINTTFTVGFGAILLGIGFYVMFKANYEFWESIFPAR